mgnify:CR=1 FL=1
MVDRRDTNADADIVSFCDRYWYQIKTVYSLASLAIILGTYPAYAPDLQMYSNTNLVPRMQ